MKKSYHSRELPSNPAPSSLRQFLRNAASSRSFSKRNAVLSMAAIVSPFTPQGAWTDPPSAALLPSAETLNAQRVRSRTTEGLLGPRSVITRRTVPTRDTRAEGAGADEAADGT